MEWPFAQEKKTKSLEQEVKHFLEIFVEHLTFQPPKRNIVSWVAMYFEIRLVEVIYEHSLNTIDIEHSSLQGEILPLQTRKTRGIRRGPAIFVPAPEQSAASAARRNTEVSLMNEISAL